VNLTQVLFSSLRRWGGVERQGWEGDRERGGLLGGELGGDAGDADFIIFDPRSEVEGRVGGGGHSLLFEDDLPQHVDLAEVFVLAWGEMRREQREGRGQRD
jgi:hypothetical protein